MALDPRFVVTSDLESYFVDKDSGEPLAAGVVTFYRQTNQSVKKPVYQITSPGAGMYEYTALPNPCILSSVGTFQDALGNNIVPYYFPYTGDQDDSTNVLDLYYITVYSSGGILQFTRIGWPNFSAEDGSSALNTKNYIPNGQFLAHNDIVSATEPPVTVVQYGSGTVNSQAIAQGGWNFVRTTGGSSVFDNSFTTAPVLGGFGLKDFPRYAFNFKCTTFNASDTIRDLSIQWPNVYTFSADGTTPGTQDYTFFFHHHSNDGNSYTFTVFLIYNFGTGGTPSSPIETQIGTFVSTPTVSPENIVIPGFPANSGTLGTNNDDYVAISIRGPAQTWDAQFTDFALVFGMQTLAVFPVQTNAEQLDEGVAGWMPTPNPDGSDLYLPLVLTPTGMAWDHSQIGMIESSLDQVSSSVHPSTNLILCDGSQYLTSDYSPLGIPYTRLQQFLFNNGNGTSFNVPIFGTGTTYVAAYISTGLTTQIMLGTNQPVLQTAPADGAAPTGFTFGPAVKNGAVSIGFNSYCNNQAYATATSSPFVTPALAGASAGTSGFTVSETVDSNSTGLIYNIEVLTIAAAGLAGLYWLFSSNSVSYYMWFTVNGAGADPAVGGRTGINVALRATMSAIDVAMAVATTLGAKQMDLITIAAVPPASSYFTFNANSLKYTVWYKVDNVGTQPVVASTAKYIEVDVLSADTAAQVATKTQIKINSLYFAVPDLRGTFLRGGTPDLASGGKWDMTVNSRFGYAFNLNPSNVGSYELGTLESHKHSITTTQAGAVNATDGSGGGAAVGSGSTVYSGQLETKPINVFVNFSIRY